MRNVIRANKQPAILVGSGFIPNPTEEKLLAPSNYQDMLQTGFMMD